LVTGATGRVGGQVVAQLAGACARVRAVGGHDPRGRGAHRTPGADVRRVGPRPRGGLPL